MTTLAPALTESLSTMPARKPAAAAAAKSIPHVHVEFRKDVDGGRYFTAMAGHKISAIEFYLTPAHIEYLGTERVDVSFGKTGIRISSSNGGTICHKVEDLVRASVIFEKMDETLFYYLFALTNGKPIMIDGSTTFVGNFDVSMKAAPAIGTTDQALVLLADKTQPLPSAVAVNPEISRKVTRRREQLQALSFPERLQQVEKLVGELSVLMESLENVPGIDTTLVVLKNGRRVRAKLKPV